MSLTHAPKTPLEKALAVNLEPSRYGAFAEIGAGQEVSRWFFQAGGAAIHKQKLFGLRDVQAVPG